MSVMVPPAQQERPVWSAHRLTVWSFLMLVVYVVWYFALGMLGMMVLLPALGLSEGDLLLMAGGVAGWVAEVGMSLLLVAPLVVGVVLAVTAIRRGGRWAWVALVLNGLLVLQVVFAFLDTIHMTYYPQGGWLFW